MLFSGQCKNCLGLLLALKQAGRCQLRECETGSISPRLCYLLVAVGFLETVLQAEFQIC